MTTQAGLSISSRTRNTDGAFIVEAILDLRSSSTRQVMAHYVNA